MPLNFDTNWDNAKFEWLHPRNKELIQHLDQLNCIMNISDFVPLEQFKTLLLPLLFYNKYHSNKQFIMSMRTVRTAKYKCVPDIWEDWRVGDAKHLTLNLIALTAENNTRTQEIYMSIPITMKSEQLILQVSPNLSVRLIKHNDYSYVIMASAFSPKLLGRIILLLPLLFKDVLVDNDPESHYNKFITALSYERVNLIVKHLHAVINSGLKDLDEKIKVIALDTWLQNMDKIELNRLQSEADNINVRLRRLEEDHHDYLQELTRIQKELYVTRNMKNGEASAFAEYMMHRKDLEKIQINQTSLTLVMLCPCTNYDQQTIETYIADDRHGGSYFSRNAKAMKHLFIDQDHTLYLHSVIEMNFDTGIVQALKGWDSDYATKGLPNYHHYIFNCWGNGGPKINRAMQEKDYIMAMELISSGVKNLNFYEAGNIEDLFKRGENKSSNVFSYPCVDLNDGTPWLTWKEYALRCSLEEDT